MLLNKVLFVSLLVLGLCFLQPALGKERLAKRIAGGTVATAGQFPFVVLIQYPFTDSTGNTFTYQGTGVIYNNNLVLTTANAVAKCNNVQMTITQGSVTTFSPGASAQQLVFTCVLGTNIILPTGFVPGVYTNDIAQIILPLSFTGQVSLRVPTSSPTAADIGKLFAVGWGESVPGAQPSPQLLYVPLNPQRNHVCYNRALSLGITGNFSFSENFCVAGFVQSPATGVVTDACVFDAGAPIIRTSNINSPYADHELIGLVNFGSCSASSPVIATYLFKYLPTLPAQTAAPPAGSPANPRSFDGNFACGDGVVQAGGYEKCDPPTTVIADRENPTFCCNPWTCQYEVAGTACTVDNRNGTKCRSQPRCNNRGNCVVKFKKGIKCNGPKTKCHLGKCCTYPGATNCV